MREIGSEFSYNKIIGKGIKLPKNVKDYSYTFCGRTAIETVLDNESKIKKVMLPSYCCDSVIEPFRRRGVDIYFYDVNYDDGLQINISTDANVDAIFWCNYFGFNRKMPNFQKFIKNGGIVIEDITHSFYSSKKYDDQSHYLVASLRKWEPILSGGYCGSLKEKMRYKPLKSPIEKFLYEKKKAMLLKKEYLEGININNKDEYLEYFSESNKWLSENYSNLKIDDESQNILKHCINMERNITKRKNNAKILYDGLKDIDFITFLFDEKDMDCPLFVPILINKKSRNDIRDTLIENNIYCPIHWPKPKMNCNSNIYNKELSLICDQRYDEIDMLKIIEIIKKCK
ncbi:hypothetical protein [Fusobacterium sp.]|uniref:hypothetical protein n=1 Tax=Fusobacterium sp. TaxID=68766 RepID=UPI000C701DA0|nr:hypothetical protein [Fusobacterium sp.]